MSTLARTETYKPALFGLCLIALVWTVPVLLAGGWTTTINAGMAFRDWPLSHGSINPEGFLRDADQTAEHSHRLAAATLGFVSLVIAGLTWRYEARSRVRKLALGLPALVVFQGLLGGARVLFDRENFKDLSSNVSRTFAISHAVTALLTVGLLTLLVVSQSKRWFAPSTGEGVKPGIRRFAVVTAGAIWLQALLGALVRQHRWSIWDMSGRPADASPVPYLGEWATGKFLAQMSSGWPFALNAAHRIGALAVAALVLTLGVRVARDAGARREIGTFTAALVLATLFQIALGVIQIWFNANTEARNAHHLGGAVVFCLAAATALFAARRDLSSKETVA